MSETSELESPAEELARIEGTSMRESPPWDRATKTIVALIVLVILILVFNRFSSLIVQVAAAFVLAYLLNPFVQFLENRTRLSRGVSILLVYLSVIIILIWVIVAFGVSTGQSIRNFIEFVPELIQTIINFLAGLTVIAIGPFSIDVAAIDWVALGSQLTDFIRPAVQTGGQTAISIFTSVVGFLGSSFFVFLISLYLAFEIPNLGSYIGSAAQQPGYRKDVERLIDEFGDIWKAYLRGQVTLALIVGFAVWLGLFLLGVEAAFSLGMLAGLLEFLPYLGPIISTVAAVVAALIQGDNFWGMSPEIFALLVLIWMLIVQQVENGVLVPRIVGNALELNPAIVIIGVAAGGSVAGLVGVILAAPILATIKLLGTYVWRKFFDLEPFEDEYDEPGEFLGRGMIGRLRKRLRDRGKKTEAIASE